MGHIACSRILSHVFHVNLAITDGERCADTIQSIFDNAKNPDKVSIALVEQVVPDDDFCMEKYCEKYGAKVMARDVIRKDMSKVKSLPDNFKDCPRFDQVHRVAFHSLAAKGPTYARSLARKVLGNEEYCMQVDSHTTFAKDWDAILKTEWKSAGNEFGVISSMPPDKSQMKELEPGGSNESEVIRSCRVLFRDNGFPVSRFMFWLERFSARFRLTFVGLPFIAYDRILNRKRETRKRRRISPSHY